MSSEESSRQQQSSSRRNVVIAVIVMLVIVIALFLVFRGQTTTTKGPGTDYANSSSLSCTANRVNNGIFATSNAGDTSYDISIIFHDDALHKLTYNFSGVYADHATAVRAEATLHADIGKYLQDHGSSLEATASNNFSVNGSEVRFSITANSDDLTTQTAPVFMLNTTNIDTDNPRVPHTLKEVKDNYTQHGFICEEQD